MYRRAFFFIAVALAAIVGCDENASHSPATKTVDTREHVQVTFYATRTGSKYHRDGCLFSCKEQDSNWSGRSKTWIRCLLINNGRLGL